ncbi:nucleotidyltransferase family protein [Sulfurimonas sp.]|uniref:nucleotidyltransferase family protein n=1 Tax=Sulfurimonas sp. TaxID=2022749 RepID=UPI002AB0BCB4|nr:nucleotidyltransferase family protein [Sulfurimonas sp.]
MTKQEILVSLKKNTPVLSEKFGIKQLALFGSYAKNEQTENSDIDILVVKMEQKNMLTLLKAKRFLSDLFDKEVDIGLFDSLRPFIKNRVQNEMIYVK